MSNNLDSNFEIFVNIALVNICEVYISFLSVLTCQISCRLHTAAKATVRSLVTCTGTMPHRFSGMLCSAGTMVYEDCILESSSEVSSCLESLQTWVKVLTFLLAPKWRWMCHSQFLKIAFRFLTYGSQR